MKKKINFFLSEERRQKLLITLLLLGYKGVKNFKKSFIFLFKKLQWGFPHNDGVGLNEKNLVTHMWVPKKKRHFQWQNSLFEEFDHGSD